MTNWQTEHFQKTLPHHAAILEELGWGSPDWDDFERSVDGPSGIAALERLRAVLHRRHVFGSAAEEAIDALINEKTPQ
jgi:hypothetical protein